MRDVRLLLLTFRFLLRRTVLGTPSAATAGRLLITTLDRRFRGFFVGNQVWPPSPGLTAKRGV